jgi:PAS domain S-box-containing protein
LAQLVNASHDGILALDRRHRVTFWNRAMERMTGIFATDALGRDPFDLLPFLRTVGADQHVEKALRGVPARTGVLPFSVPARRRAGLFEASYAPLLAEDGGIVGAVGILRDVTEEKLAEEQLQESEVRFRTMADFAPVLLWMAGTDALCSFFNQGWLEFTGRTMEQEVGNGWAEGVHAEDFQGCMDIYLTAFVARRPFRMEYRLRRADGEYRWILDQGVPRFAPDGSFAGYIGSCIDVTDFRDAQAELRRINDELEVRVQERTAELSRSNAELEQFAYAASHDLQEPLRMVSSYVQLLARRYEGRLGAQADEFIRYAADGAQRMQQMITDLLEYSRVGRQRVPFATTRLDDALERALVNLRVAIAEAGAVVTHEPLPTVLADTAQMSRLFQNIIGNAIKFRGDRAPEVRITVERRGEHWQIAVRDNGIGVDPQYANRLFQVFQRLHPRDRYPGSGVGLAICKRIVERHGGRIWVESEPGKGAAFLFTLPAATGEAAC